jgi:SAM-dependent methyltransferase
MNDENLAFYNNISLELFKDYAEKGGFQNCWDLEMISHHIDSYDTLLEIGAGYGRCLDYFINKGHIGKIVAIERSDNLVEYLKIKYSNFIDLFHGDIKQIDFFECVDNALWMWSGMIDFSREEQIICCKRIYTALKPGGRLFVDVPKLGIQTIAIHKDSQNLKLETAHGDIHAYIPDDADMEKIRDLAGYSVLSKINYATATQKYMSIYILER